MFEKDKLVLSIELPILSEIRQFCNISEIDLATYMTQLITQGCINHMLNNHAVLFNFYKSNPSLFVSLLNENINNEV